MQECLEIPASWLFSSWGIYGEFLVALEDPLYLWARWLVVFPFILHGRALPPTHMSALRRQGQSHHSLFPGACAPGFACPACFPLCSQPYFLMLYCRFLVVLRVYAVSPVFVFELCVLFSYCWAWEFLKYSGCKSYVIYIVCKSFLPIFFSLSFFNSTFCRVKVCNFDKVHFTRFFLLWIIFLFSYLRTFCLTSDHEDFSLYHLLEVLMYYALHPDRWSISSEFLCKVWDLSWGCFLCL